jgi:arginase
VFGSSVRAAYIGLRDIDEEESAALKRSNVHVFTMRDVDKHGIARVIEMAMKGIDPNGRRPLHLSLDIDSVDPAFAPGTGTCARGGTPSPGLKDQARRTRLKATTVELLISPSRLSP